MLLQNKETGNLIEVLDVKELVNPNSNVIRGQEQAGEEEQEPLEFAKEELIFPSGESLPRCWLDANYKNAKAA